MAATQQAPVLLLLGRVFWLVLGPFLLIILCIAGFTKGGGWLTGADLGFLAILCALVLARWYEFHGGNPRTNMGEPATWSHFHRYVLVVIPLGLGIWVLANIVENHILVP